MSCEQKSLAWLHVQAVSFGSSGAVVGADVSIEHNSLTCLFVVSNASLMYCMVSPEILVSWPLAVVSA